MKLNTNTLLLLALGYLLLVRRPGAAPAGGGGVTGPAYVQTAAGTALNIPGIGSYRSGPGGTQVAVDPNFFDRLFGFLRGGTPGQGAEPAPAFVGEGSPALPDGTWANLNQLTGGVWDAYRAGERDPALDVVNIPIDPVADPASFVPVDPGPVSPTFDPCEVDPSWCGAWSDGVSWVG